TSQAQRSRDAAVQAHWKFLGHSRLVARGLARVFCLDPNFTAVAPAAHAAAMQPRPHAAKDADAGALGHVEHPLARLAFGFNIFAFERDLGQTPLRRPLL